MSPATKLCLASSGVFLLFGMFAGILKYRGVMTAPDHRAPVYIDVCHRAALLYSFALLVMGKLIEYSPYSSSVQLVLTGVPLFFFALAVITYLRLGLENKTENQFTERNFGTTWMVYALIVGELGGLGGIVWGFFKTQILP